MPIAMMMSLCLCQASVLNDGSIVLPTALQLSCQGSVLVLVHSRVSLYLTLYVGKVITGRPVRLLLAGVTLLLLLVCALLLFFGVGVSMVAVTIAVAGK